MIDDPFNLQRFVDAQANGVYEQALAEIWAGEKRSHWMWFIFPQHRNLGRSATAKYCGPTSWARARLSRGSRTGFIPSVRVRAGRFRQ